MLRNEIFSHIEPLKVFFDLYSTSGGKMNDQEYDKWHNEQNVYIALPTAKVYTIIKYHAIFDNDLHTGMFVDIYPFDTIEQLEKEAQNFIAKKDLKFVSLQDFLLIDRKVCHTH